MLLILLIVLILIRAGIGFVPYLDKFGVFEKDERGKLKLNTYDDWVLMLKYHKELCDFATENKPTKTKNWYHPNIKAFKGCGKEAVESIATHRTDGGN
tara:strand:- start:4083 stop:4376 length:294 start_codon:yes stop_codon:yes gene_type:complete